MGKLKLELTLEEVNMVLSALSELPFKISNEMINNITAQAQSQLNTVTPAVPTVTPEVAN